MLGMIALCLLASAPSAPSAPSAASSVPWPGFCKPELVVRDYQKALSRFPQSGGFAASGRLRQGPALLRVFPPREDLVASGRGQFEARGSLAGRAPSPSTPLDWWVQSRLIRVGEKQRGGQLVKAKRQYIGQLEGFRRRNFGFGGGVQPGIYRLEVTFENRSGDLVDKYQEYFRVLTARSNLKLAINSMSLRPGSTGYLRVENFGTVGASYSYEYRIWTADDGSVELPLEQQIVTRDRPLVRPGWAGECFQFQIPASAPAGNYRIGIRASDPVLAKPVLIAANFSVEY